MVINRIIDNASVAIASLNRRPVIYYTNGYEHWFWDDLNYPSRAVQGFHTKDELELIMQRRSGRMSLAKAKINNDIVERSYQHEAIRKITEAFEKNNEKRNITSRLRRYL